MTLYLVQHGRSLPKEIDPERGLTDQGRLEVEQVASKARSIGLHVTQVIHSGKKRAEQTAEIFAAYLTSGTQPKRETGLNPNDDAAAFSRTLVRRDELLVVGHLPFMERLVSYLITGSPDKPVIRFRNAGIVCLEREGEPGTWVIRWALTPEIA
ncbi:MAG TPA: phosphohistidine phosphatase SixA [Desulfomonilia bacterium]|nr:phosphohistidine phosphatase SixA [Desulfomonilia bacterium]